MGDYEMVPTTEEGWPQVIKELAKQLATNDPEELLAANDPENLLARNDGYEDPGDSANDRESIAPRPILPGSRGAAKEINDSAVEET